MDGRWGLSIVEGWLDQVEALDLWVGLFFADPMSVSDPLSVEVIGPAYARQHPAWTRSSPYALTMTDETVFRALPPGTNVVAAAVMAGSTSSLLVARELVSPVRTYPTGGTYRIDANEWSIGIQVPAA